MNIYSIFNNFIANIPGFKERLISIIIFIVVLCLFYILLSKQKNYKGVLYILFFYMVLLFIMAYNFKPTQSVDLYRIINYYIVNMRNMSFDSFLQNVIQKVDFSTYSLYFLASRFSSNGLLSLFASMIFYPLAFYILYDFSKINNLSCKTIAKTLFVFMIFGQYVSVVVGIKNMCAFILCAFCIYRELYKRKSFVLNIPFYFIAIGFHTACIPIVAIRLFLVLKDYNNNVLKRLFNYSMVIVLIFVFAKYGNFFLQNTIDKTMTYLSGVKYFTWDYIATICKLLIMFIILIFLNREKNDDLIFQNNILYRKFYNYIFIVIIAFSLFEPNIFIRYTNFLSILNIPYFLLYFSIVEKKSTKLVMPKYIFLERIVFIILFLIEISRCELYALKFF